MARFGESQDPIASHVPGDEDDDWGSDFEGELCLREIEDNKINEIREANLLKNSPTNVQAPIGDSSQTGNRSYNATKTGAIPKSGFSYLSNTANTDSNGVFRSLGNESRNIVHPQRQVSQPRMASMNPDNSERLPHTQSTLDSDAETKKTPRKLKPEAFSFLNKLPTKNTTENGFDINKVRKTLIPTAFSHAEKLSVSQSPDDAINTIEESSDPSNNIIASAPPLENTSSNYEPVNEDGFSEFTLSPASSLADKENVPLPPLPTRPPPVFKYPPETFSKSVSVESTCNIAVSQLLSQSITDYPNCAHSISSPLPTRPPPVLKHPPETFSKPASVESTSNLAISQPHSQSVPAYPKLAHSISSPDSGSKPTTVTTEDRILSNKIKNRKSLPATTVYPAVPKRPLPPLPISEPGNVSRIKSHGEIKLESTDSVNDEKWLEEAPSIHDMIPSHQANQPSKCKEPIQHIAVQNSIVQEQQFSNPQHRLAQILTSQTSVDNSVLFSQQKIASAIASRAVRSQNSSISRLPNTEGSDSQTGGRPTELNRMISRRSFENDAEETNEDETEQQPSYLEAKDAAIPRRFTDHETLINAMNRPALPQKAPPMQRSVSCNSLVQSIKDLSFSVWSKPEKKRNSDGINDPKKNTRSISVSSSSKIKCTAPISITLIPTETPNEVANPHQVKTDASSLDEKNTLQEYPWFHDVDAREGQLRLQSVGQEGTFLIRPSSRPTEDIQNTLCIFYNGRVRNLHIRRTEDGRYVLGTKSGRTFSSLSEMIRHHKEIPVEILPHSSTPIKPQLYRILLRESPPKLQKQFAFV